MKANVIKSNEEIYAVLTEKLEKISQPITCVDAMDSPEIRAAAFRRWGNDPAAVTMKLSDHLGYMWRKGLLDRFNAPQTTSMARYAYALKNRFSDYDTPISYVPPAQTKHKGDLEIIEKDGEIILNFEKFTVVIKPR